MPVIRPLVLLCTAMAGLLLAVTIHGHAQAQRAATPSPASAVAIDEFLEAKGSPMAGQGAAFVASGGRWQVDPRLLVAIAGAESSFGAITCAPYNAWGWGCPNGPYRFTSWADGIETVTRGLRENYLSEGRTSVAAIHQKYAPIGAANDPTGLNNAWTTNVTSILTELGGDPLNIDLSGAPGRLYVGILANPELDATAYGAARAEHEQTVMLAPSGAPATLELSLENTGAVDWTAETVRLRRIDDVRGVASAPYAALVEDTVAPGERGSFRVDVAAHAGADGGTLRFRPEGLRGSFGAVMAVDAVVARQGLLATGVRTLVGGDAYRGRPVELAAGSEAAIIVTYRNDGTSTWWRDAAPAPQLEPARGSGLLAAGSAGTMLQREAAPGEFADFALPLDASEAGQFRVRMRLVVDGEPVPGGAETARITVVV